MTAMVIRVMVMAMATVTPAMAMATATETATPTTHRPSTPSRSTAPQPPPPLEAAGPINLQVTASDPDNDLSRVEFEVDASVLGSVGGTGPVFDLEWLLSGANDNGDYTLTATAYDQADNASEPVSIPLGVLMPDGGGELEQWTYDSGLLDSAYDIAVSPDGEQVVIAGQTSTMFGSGQRVDRVFGPAWADKVEALSIAAAGVVWADGTFVVAGSLFSNPALDTALYGYAEDGSLTNTWPIDSSRPELGNPELVDTPNGLARDSTGRLYASGTYTPQSGPLMGMRASFILAATPNGDQEWLRWPTEDPNIAGDPIVSELAVSADDELAAVGTNGGRIWVSRWDANGQLLAEHTVTDGTATEGHALATANDGALYIGGAIEDNGSLRSWLRKLDADDNELWTDMPPHIGQGVTAAIAVDAWGEVVTASTEGCMAGGNGLTACELVVRKYDADGSLMWSQTWDAETFSGPLDNLPGFDASLALDRFGYVYVTAIAYTNNTGTDWWARKLHP